MTFLHYSVISQTSPIHYDCHTFLSSMPHLPFMTATPPFRYCNILSLQRHLPRMTITPAPAFRYCYSSLLWPQHPPLCLLNDPVMIATLPFIKASIPLHDVNIFLSWMLQSLSFYTKFFLSWLPHLSSWRQHLSFLTVSTLSLMTGTPSFHDHYTSHHDCNNAFLSWLLRLPAWLIYSIISKPCQRRRTRHLPLVLINYFLSKNKLFNLLATMSIRRAWGLLGMRRRGTAPQVRIAAPTLSHHIKTLAGLKLSNMMSDISTWNTIINSHCFNIDGHDLKLRTEV